MRSFLTAVLIGCTLSCASDTVQTSEPGTGPAVSDAALYAMSQADATWAFYKRSSTPITRPSQPHPESRALVRYNARAAAQLDAQGKVRSGASFPDSSIIVKELFNGSTLSTIAVMMKRTGSASAGPAGWVWAEFGPTGAVKISTASRGGACTGCHVVGIDYTRMNDTHP